MDVLSIKIRREQLNPGDHIYTWRCGYSYSHHGIYVDDGKVIHLTRAPGLIIFSSSRDESSPSHPSGEDRVVCCSIEEFVSGGDLYLYEYGVNRALFLIKRGGTCTPITSDPPKDVLHRASVLLKKGFGHYNLFGNNCEDFAIYCKTGLLSVGKSNNFGSSGQIQFLLALVSCVIYTPSHFLSLNLVLLINGLLYCGFRLIILNEIVEKVAVEKFYDLRNQRTEVSGLLMENRSTEVSGLRRVDKSNSFDSSELIIKLLLPLLFALMRIPSQFLPLDLAILVCGLLLYYGLRLIFIIITAVKKSDDLEDQLTTKMENRSTEVSGLLMENRSTEVSGLLMENRSTEVSGLLMENRSTEVSGLLMENRCTEVSGLLMENHCTEVSGLLMENRCTEVSGLLMENRSTEVSGLRRVDKSNSFDSSGLIQLLLSLLFALIRIPFRFLPLGLALLVCGLLLYYGFRLIFIIVTAVEKSDDLEDQLTPKMENRSTEVYLSAKYYITYSILIFNFWTPTIRVLLFIFLYYFGLYSSAFDLLSNGPINLKPEEYVGWIIWALGYWHWRSESRILFRTKLICLESFLFLFVSNQTRRSKLGDYIAHTILVLGCCYWAPESTILLWIRLVLFHKFLFYFVSNQLLNNHSKFAKCFFACFVIHSAILFYEIGLRGLFF